MESETINDTQQSAALAQRAGELGRATVAAYLADLDVSDKSRATYGRALGSWLRWLEAEGLAVNTVTGAHAMAYKRHLAESHKPSTVNAYLVAARGLYAWLNVRTGYPNVFAGVRGVRGSGNRTSTAHDALSVDQARRVAAHRDGDSLGSLRDAAMVNVMLRCGLRTVEVVRADVGDLRTMGGRSVLFVWGKGRASADEFVVLDRAALAPITAYLQARGAVSDHEPLFAGVGNRNAGGRLTTRTVSRVAKRTMEAEGIVDGRFTAHSLRHTAVTLALLGGATVQEAQAMARHADISTTLIYSHNLDRLQGVAERSVSAILEG